MSLRFLTPCLLLTTAVLAYGAEKSKIDTSVFANERLKTTLQSLEIKADSFEDKLDSALDSSKLEDSEIADLLNNWAEALEDEADDMDEAFSDKQSAAFNSRFENSMLIATAINRAMLRHDFASYAESEWRSLREDLNSVATLLNRELLPNLTVIKFTSAPPDALTRSEIKQVMDELEASTDRFKEKFEKAKFTSIARDDQKRIFTSWAEAVEDTSDDMLEEYREQDAKEVRKELERTLLFASGVNRMMLGSDTSEAPVLEWNKVREQLNTLAKTFGYPVLPGKTSGSTQAETRR